MPCEEAVSAADEDFVYRKGETVYPEEAFDNHLLDDGSGIHFFLTRTEAEQFEYRTDDAWSAEARQKEAECECKIISFEEFKAWLKRE